jgi:hypothetical protein
VTTVVALKHTNAMIATNALRPFLTSTAGGGNSITLGTIGNGASLMLCGPQNQVAHAIKLVRAADVPSEQPEPGLAERITKLEKRLAELEQQLAEQKGR